LRRDLVVIVSDLPHVGNFSVVGLTKQSGKADGI
jgi:hypothetical protein